jgi:hypothetical protein
MPGSSQPRRRTRIERSVRPALGPSSDGSAPLESRTLLSVIHVSAAHTDRVDAHLEHSAAHKAHHTKPATHSSRRIPPLQEINAQYTAFTAAFNNVLGAYTQAINEESTGKESVNTTVTVAYTTPSAIIQVANAAVFGPLGTFQPAITATATVGNVSLGTFSITGSAAGNLLIIAVPPASTATNLPVGTTLSANVFTSAQTSAASIFPSYITNSTNLLATTLVKYFNSLPIPLPHSNTPPHTPVQENAIQMYVFQNIAGSAANSLKQLLLAIPLPTTTGSDLAIYQAAVDTAIVQSHQQVIDGIGEIYARTLYVNAPAPANRLGIIYNSGTTGGTSSPTSSSTGTA